MKYAVDNLEGKNCYEILDGEFTGTKFIINDIKFSEEDENEMIIDHTILNNDKSKLTDQQDQQLTELIGNIIIDALIKITEEYKETNDVDQGQIDTIETSNG